MPSPRQNPALLARPVVGYNEIMTTLALNEEDPLAVTLVQTFTGPQQRVCMKASASRKDGAKADLAGQVPCDFLGSGG